MDRIPRCRLTFFFSCVKIYFIPKFLVKYNNIVLKDFVTLCVVCRVLGKSVVAGSSHADVLLFWFKEKYNYIFYITIMICNAYNTVYIEF